MRIARVIDAGNREQWASQDASGKLTALEGDPWTGFKPAGREVNAKRWLAPVIPPAILCVGLNYRKHAEEGNIPIPKYPVLFMKNPSAATGHNEPIRVPAVCGDEIDYESELAVVIGKTCCDVPVDKALDYVLGYTIANDVSARIWQLEQGGSQWNRGKSFDTFAPLGPVLVTPDELPNPNELAIKGTLNGKTVQESNTRDMIFTVETLISFLSQDTTLLPGTVILTGTPQGIGWVRKPRLLLHPGDEISVEIEKIGKLTNRVSAK